MYPNGNDKVLLMIDDCTVTQSNNMRALERHGYSVRQASTLKEAKKLMASHKPCAIVMETKLPDGCGLEFLRGLREESNVPVMLLSSGKTNEDIIEGFEAGGDDYLPKPYNPAIFLMRLSSLMRRATMIPDTLKFGPILMDPASSKAYLNGEDMLLQQKEFSLLQQFIQHASRPVKKKIGEKGGGGGAISSERLYRVAWGDTLPNKNSLKVAISKLRSKLAGSGYTISSTKNDGYFLERE